RLTHWHGNSNWGSRYELIPVWLMVLVALPLLAEAWAGLSRPGKAIATLLIGVSITIQLASLVFPCYLERMQGSSPTQVFVVGRRFVNIAAVVTGHVPEWSLDSAVTAEQRASVEQVLIPELLPYRLARRGLSRLAALAWPVWAFLVLLVAVQVASL